MAVSCKKILESMLRDICPIELQSDYVHVGRGNLPFEDLFNLLLCRLS